MPTRYFETWETNYGFNGVWGSVINETKENWFVETATGSVRILKKAKGPRCLW